MSVDTHDALKTPLYEKHIEAQGKIVPFAGYLLPVEYPAGLIEEHLAVRTRAGLFDVSHMGEVLLRGSGALNSLNHLLTNDFTEQPVGKCRYSALCYPDGGMVDDLIVYRRGEQDFLIVVNAANKDKDVAYMRENLLEDTELIDASDQYAQLALQGPCAQSIAEELVSDTESLPKGYYTFTENVEVAGVSCIVSRTGYTGEDGFELYCSPEDAPALWDALMQAGASQGILPCGLGARDTLRLEASMPLYGHEMDETVSPLETGLAFGVRMNKPDFIGKTALEASLAQSPEGKPARERIGLAITGRGIAREHCPVNKGERSIGMTTSGTYFPFLKFAGAMALVEAGSVSVGDTVTVTVRGRTLEAEVVPLPFYKRNRS